MRLCTPAVVLRTVDYGEADRVVTLFTRAAGKLSALARGARKSARRFGAGLGLFGVGEAVLRDKPNAELAGLERFDGARGFPGLMADVAKVAHGSYALELVRELSAPRQPEPAVFELIVTYLAVLEAAPARAETVRVFELQLLDALGLRPNFAEEWHGPALADEVRDALLEAQTLALVDADDLVLSKEVNAGCRQTLCRIILEHVGRPLKSLEFIAKINHA